MERDVMLFVDQNNYLVLAFLFQIFCIWGKMLVALVKSIN